MRGFTDKALILCMDPTLFDNKPEEYKSRYKKSLNNLVAYCKHEAIDPYIFHTDELAVEFLWDKCTVLETLTAGDGFFMTQHNKVMQSLKSCGVKPANEYKEIIQKAAQKIPYPETPTTDQRFDVIVKREHKVSTEIIKSFKLVFNFQIKNKMQYHAKTKEGDGRMVVNFNASTFHGHSEISGKEINILDALSYPGANRALFLWEVEEWNSIT